MRLALKMFVAAALPGLAVVAVAAAFPGAGLDRFGGPPAVGPTHLLAGVAVLTAAVSALLLGRAVSGPLRVLVRACREIGRGRTPERLSSQGGDEVGAVAAAFNEMARALDASRAHIAEVLRGDQLVLDVLTHDVKNQVAAVLPRIDMLVADHPELQPELAKTVGPLERAVGIMEDALLLLRLQGEPHRDGEAREDVGALTRAAVASQAAAAEDRGTSIALSAPGGPLGPASPLVGRAVENLVSNAVKYSPPKRPVEVRIEPRIRSVRIAVVDHGPGLPHGKHHLLFQRFQRLDNGPAKGTGLGLAIAKRIVDREGGRIWAEDTPGGGATFVLEIPAPGPAAGASPPPRERAPAGSPMAPLAAARGGRP